MTHQSALTAVVALSCCLFAATVSAAFRTKVTKADYFRADLVRIAVVTVDCDEAVDRSEIEQRLS